MNYQKMRIDFMQKRGLTAPFVYKTGEIDVDGIEAELVNIDVEGSPIGFIKLVSPTGIERESALRIENGFAYFDIPKNEEGLYTVELTILNKKNKTRSGNIAIEVINSLSYDSEEYETLLDTITQHDAEYTTNENIRIENENARIKTFDEIKTDFENLTVGKQLDSEVIIARSGKASLKDNIESKRDKSVLLTQSDLSTSSESHKLTMNHLSQEVKNAMTGTAPVSPNIEDGQVTFEKLAFKPYRIISDEFINVTTDVKLPAPTLGQLNSSGNVVGSSTYITFEFIKVNSVDMFEMFPLRSFALFDSNKAKIHYRDFGYLTAEDYTSQLIDLRTYPNAKYMSLMPQNFGGKPLDFLESCVLSRVNSFEDCDYADVRIVDIHPKLIKYEKGALKHDMIDAFSEQLEITLEPFVEGIFYSDGSIKQDSTFWITDKIELTPNTYVLKRCRQVLVRDVNGALLKLVNNPNNETLTIPFDSTVILELTYAKRYDGTASIVSFQPTGFIKESHLDETLLHALEKRKTISAYDDLDFSSYRDTAMFSFVFDDGHTESLNNYSTEFKKYDLRCGFGIITSDSNNYDQLAKLQDDGFEILSHSKTHGSFKVADNDSWAEDELLGSKQKLEQNGLVIRGFVTPMSEMHESYIPLLEKYYKYGYTVYTGNHTDSSYSSRFVKKSKLSRYSLESLTEETILSIIEESILENRCVHFYAHNLPATNLTVDKLNNILSFLKIKQDENKCRVVLPYRATLGQYSEFEKSILATINNEVSNAAKVNLNEVEITIGNIAKNK